MTSKIAEAQAYVDPILIAEAIINFHVKFRHIYPEHVHLALGAVGPLQTLIGAAIAEGILTVGPGAKHVHL